MNTIILQPTWKMLKADIAGFCTKYNYFESALAELSEDEVKKCLVANMYKELGTAMGVAMDKRFGILIKNLVEAVNKYDRYVEQGASIRKCRNYSWFKNALPLAEGCGITNYPEIAARTEKSLAEYFELENRAQVGEVNLVKLVKLLRKRNCDFHFYNALFEDYLTQFRKPFGSLFKQLKQFFSHYLMVDIILDDLCDYKNDMKTGAFNSFIIVGKKNEPATLAISGKQLLDVAERHGCVALQIASKIRATKVRKLLTCYAMGELTGLKIFRKYKCGDEFPDYLREDLTQLLLKPHPWERRSAVDILNKWKKW